MRILTLLLGVVLISLSPLRAEWEMLDEIKDKSDRRVLRVFDFEERDDGNFEETPMFFNRVTGIGMPHWVGGRLTRTRARTGDFSFQLDLNGGSALYRLEHRVLPAVAGAHYRIDGYVKTTTLKYARARMSLMITDADGRVIPGSVRHSGPFVTPDDAAEAWQSLSVATHTDDADARWLVLELGLLQPAAGGQDDVPEPGAAGPSLGGAAGDELLKYQQDVRGSAWFDDLVVSRVPQLQVKRLKPSGVFLASDRVRIQATALDPMVEDLDATARVFDATGRVVWAGEAIRHQSVQHADGDGSEAGGVASLNFDFDFGPMPPGWYEAVLDVSADTGHLRAGSSTRRSPFVVLASGPVLDRDERFSIDATHLAAANWSLLQPLIGPLGAGRVELALWGGASGNDAGRSVEELDEAATSLEAMDVSITGVFAGSTPTLAAVAGDASLQKLYDLLAIDKTSHSAWRSSLGYLVSRHAHQIDRWQVGLATDAEAFASEERLRLLYAKFGGVIASLTPEPRLSMPWPTRRSVAGVEPAPAVLAMSLPTDVPASQMPLFVAEATRSGGDAEVAVRLELLDPEIYGRRVMLSDLIRRVTLALAGGADRLTLPLPVASARGERTDAPPEPTEAFVVLQTLLASLSNKTYQGRVLAGDVDDRVEAYLFADADDRDAPGTLVVWSDAADPSRASNVSLAINLGPDAEQVDAWGNRRQLRQSKIGREQGLAQAAITAMPSFVVGVDTPLTRLRQTVRLDDPLIESSFRPHPRLLLMTNTFGQSISGTIRVNEPDGWDVQLSSATFSLNPGETMARPVELQIPYNSDAGLHRIDVEITLTGGRTGGALTMIRVPLEVRLGLADVGLRTTCRRDGADLVVMQTVTNYGDETIDFEAFVLVPGQARQERLVVNLGAGRETERRYRFEGAGDVPAGSEILSGLRELEGTRILNDRVEL